MIAQLFVFSLTLLPSRCDQRDGLVARADEVIDRLTEDRSAALRTEHDR